MEQPPQQRILSLSHLSAIDVPPPQFIENAAAAGFNAVGLRVAQTPRDRGFQLLEGSALLRDTRQALHDNGMRVLDAEVIKLHPGSSREDWMHVLEAGQALSASYLLVTVIDDDYQRATTLFGELAAAAADHGLRCCLEPMIFSAVRDMDAAARFLADAGEGGSGILLDALHVARAGTSIDDIARQSPDLFPYCQLCDALSAEPATDENAAITEARQHRLAPGQGVLPLADLVRALPPTAAISVEAPSDRGSADPRGWAAELGAAARELFEYLDRDLDLDRTAAAGH
ncbi:sugar phosphate isomerase/epimerase [Williamsia sp. D3]|uniref:sugar phosphate isomerase/epimerase family protein n=1 Tax=Williamsia sp. D3 TaxID=1313067 RepID=UPI001F472230|nr:sugar phosphate isomerase/epimerase [Williamsia sp. D3]